jgi:hypothetical protein
MTRFLEGSSSCESILGMQEPAATVDIIAQFQSLVGARAAYPLVATLLTFALQVGKVSPYTKVLYAKIPVGWRWVTPVIVGAVMGFVHGFQAHYGLVGSLTEMVFGIFGVSLTAMGLAAGLRESPLPWSGGAGGEPPAPNP